MSGYTETLFLIPEGINPELLDPKNSVTLATTVDVPGYVVADGTYTNSAGNNVDYIVLDKNDAVYFTGGAGTTIRIDSVVLSVLNTRVLLKNQAVTTQNGIYEVKVLGAKAATDAILVRAADFDSSPSAEISGGATAFVISGTVNAGRGYMVYSPTGNATLNVDNILWTQIIANPISLQTAYDTGNTVTLAGVLPVQVTIPDGINTNALKVINNNTTNNPATILIDNNSTSGLDISSDSWNVNKAGAFSGNWKPIRTPVNDAAHPATINDGIIAYTALSVTRIVTLPLVASNAGVTLIIKDESGSCSPIVKITVDGNGAELVDGAASIDITAAYGILRVYCNGTAWFSW